MSVELFIHKIYDNQNRSSFMPALKEITPNEKQQACIDNIDGFYMVLAGPGTGKTFTLTKRIKAMIEDKGISPNEILCLTYSDAAASEMKSRIVTILGNIAINMQISTYHGLCSSIIQTYPEKFYFKDNIKIISSISKQMIAKKCLDDATAEGIDLSLLKDRWGNYYQAEATIIQAVSDIKTNRLTKEKFLSNITTNEDWEPMLAVYEDKKRAALAKNRGTKTVDSDIEKLNEKIEKAKLVWDLSEKYMELTIKQNYYDFDDMVSSVVSITEDDNNFASEIFGKYKYVMIDEYQDTNLIQNELIDIIVKNSGVENLFVVGDDDQIIYGFQGASLDNCENFLRKYPKTKVICLVENNRSAQNILDFGYQVISQDNRRLENNPEFCEYGITKRLTAKNPNIIKDETKIKYNIYDELAEENNDIVQQIKGIISREDFNGQLSDIAVLGRKNDQIEELSRLLEASGIPFQKKIQKNIFDVPSTLLLYSYLKILSNKKYSIDSQFQILMSEPFKIDEEDYNYILSQNRPLKRDFISIIEENKDYEWKNPLKINNFLNTYNKLSELKYTKSLHNLVIHTVNETGILEYYANSEINTQENILAIKRFIAEAAAYKDIYIRSFIDDNIKPGPYLSDFLSYLDRCWKSDAAPELEKSDNILNAVQLLTYHGSKGREFKYVFMPWLRTKVFEKKRNRNDFRLPITAHCEKNKEQLVKSELLKLLFVGITRAKTNLYLSFSMQNDGVSESLTELLVDVITNNPLIDIQKIESRGQIESVVKSLKTGLFDSYKNDLTERIKNIELSAHSFYTYKKCPQQYLYKEVFAIPVVSDDSTVLLDYGNAVHYALNNFIKNARVNGSYPSKDSLITSFLKKLSEYEFENEEDYINWQVRGKNALNSYYHHLTDIPVATLYASEYRFAGIPFGKMKLKGFIDLIEKNDNGSVSIYDYKTGSAKSKSQVAKDKSYENYYYQLAFYKIAYELQNNSEKVENIGLKFIEEEGKDFNIEYLNNDIQAIKNEIEEVTEKITSLNFEITENIEKNRSICSQCNYKFMCKINRTIN